MSGNCEQDPPELLLKGIDQFNAGLFYECHDTLEELWLEERATVRNLYKGILQIGVAMYHERNGNRKGAIRLLESGTDLIRPFSPVCHGVDVSSLVESADKARAFLQELPGGNIFPRELTPIIQFEV